MNTRIAAVVIVAGAVLVGTVSGQTGRHINPMVDLLAAKKAIFGLGLPTAGRGGGPGRGAQGGAGGAGTGAAPTTPPPPATPPKTPAELAKDASDHPEADYFFTASMEGNVDGGSASLIALQDALLELGNVTKSPTPRLVLPVNSKGANISGGRAPVDNPDHYITNLSKQLNAGVSSISFVEVDSAEELRKGIAALRFKSKGGTRPDDVGNAPKYWGLTEPEYRRRADVWPLNPDGEIVVTAIVETKEGLANVREIAQVKGLSILAPGAGTLGGVFRKLDANGQPVLDPNTNRPMRDDVAWEAAIQSVLAACKEFKLHCAYPVNENDVETRYQQGFNVGILQSFGDPAFRAVAKGRAISGRDKEK